MSQAKQFRSLNPDQIVATVERLSSQVETAFPGAGLTAVCKDLLSVSRLAKERAAKIRAPHYGLRLASVLLILLVIGILLVTVVTIKPKGEELTRSGLVQLLEAGTNEIILIGAAILFFATLETRIKRRRALRAIHELRSLAHIIDMHQLAKDPVSLVHRSDGIPPDRLTPEQLLLYLDFSSEMLSLCGKLAALYIQDFPDPGAVAAVDEIESLTNGLTRKIWQKMTMIQSHRDATR